MQEIERKFFIEQAPEGYESYPFHMIEQAYLCTNPVVRIRRQDSEYYLTYKGKGRLSREEYNLPLTEEVVRSKNKHTWCTGYVIHRNGFLSGQSNLLLEIRIDIDEELVHLHERVRDLDLLVLAYQLRYNSGLDYLERVKNDAQFPVVILDELVTLIHLREYHVFLIDVLVQEMIFLSVIHGRRIWLDILLVYALKCIRVTEHIYTR